MHEMPKPTAAHRKLEQLLGSWSGEEKMSPSPWDPKGGTAIGRVENRSAVDGFVVVQDYVQELDGTASFRGHGVFSVEGEEILLHWWDSMGLPPNVFRGQFEGNTLTLSFAGAQGHHRTVFSLTEPNQYEFRMDVSQDGQEWYTFMEGTYARTE